MQFVTSFTLMTSASHVDSGGAKKKQQQKNMNLVFRFHHNFIERLFTPDTLTSASPSACFFQFRFRLLADRGAHEEHRGRLESRRRTRQSG